MSVRLDVMSVRTDVHPPLELTTFSCYAGQKSAATGATRRPLPSVSGL